MGFAQTVEIIKKVEQEANHKEKEVIATKTEQLHLAKEKQKQLTQALYEELECIKSNEMEGVSEKRKELLNTHNQSAQQQIEKLRLESKLKEKEVIAFIISKILE